MGNPATIRAAPSTRAIGNSGGAKCQCVRYQGTYTASVPGAMTRNIAEPMIAAARCTIGAYSTPPRIVRIGRALASRDVLREVLVAFELCQAGRRRQCLRTALMSPTIYVTIISFCPASLCRTDANDSVALGKLMKGMFLRRSAPVGQTTVPCLPVFALGYHH